MDVSTKYYKKAVTYYNEAQMEKALYFCEKSISNSLKSAAAINLKGLLLYLKGELTEAEALWKINHDYNKDQVAKKYLENLEKDKELLRLYTKAQEAMAHMDFKDALVLLQQCAKSDFNAIGVNNALSTVYIQLGRYEEAKECIRKVTAIDKYDKVSRENTNLLIEYRVIGKTQKRKFIFGTSVIALALMVWIGNRALNKDGRNFEVDSQNNIVLKEDTSLPSNDEGEMVIEETPIVEETPVIEEIPIEEKEVYTFPRTELKNAVDSKNYEGLDELLKDVIYDELSGEDKAVYIKAKQLLIDEGVAYFYNKGREQHVEKKYEEALRYYSRAEAYSEAVHLNADILYMTGDCYESLGNIERATDYYNKYLSLYSAYGYEDTALYKLALIYKDIDINLAKKYASEIVNNYKKSIYNNSVIKSIANLK
ncbi:tetratricopeptide repeat protein [Clostridium thermarum]|uniref:tetratricopeptide repeat protein n=1 Tax=Clostridium thermarum TaxID=1716543 RepID=UPI00111F92FA|nr:tetratricopeptide repeat protein [Clostridium thermarum]